MEIIAALFMDDIALRQEPGPTTRIDLSGVQFSGPAPAPVPCTVAPHLVVLVWNPPNGGEFAALETVFHMADEAGDVDRSSEPMARNMQPLQIEPGKFNYRLIRAELPFDRYGTVIASLRIDTGEYRMVPYTLLPPVS
ncbi:MAG: hypothetical protein R2710_24280 [Acidimicrobiales bacterium]